MAFVQDGIIRQSEAAPCSPIYPSLPRQPVADIDQILADMNFQRGHPFYDDWDDWKQLVFNYHSHRVTEQHFIFNEGRGCYLSDYFIPIIDRQCAREINAKCQFYMDIYNNQSFKSSCKSLQELYQDLILVSTRTACTCVEHASRVPRADCQLYHRHRRNHILAFMWSYYRTHYGQVLRPKISKFYKYYVQLERVICSLELSRLCRFPIDLIIRPEKFYRNGKSVLRTVYLTGMLDGYTTRAMAERVEMLKAFLPHRKVGTTSQCGDGVDFSDEFLNLGIDLVKDDTAFRVVQQSWIQFDMNHRFPSEDLNKFRTMLLDVQSSFLSGLKDTIVMSGKTLMVLFATASTVALLTKNAVSVGTEMILKVLHLIYSLLFGRECENAIDKSRRVIQQSGEDVSIPFIPSMFLTHIIAPSEQILKTIWRNPHIDLIMRRIGYLGDVKVERGVERLVEWMRGVLLSVRKWYFREIHGIEEPTDLQGEQHVITVWSEEVEALVEGYYRGTFIWSETNWSVLHNLYSRGLTLTRSKSYQRWHSYVWKMVNCLGNLLEKYKHHQAGGNVIRNPPVAIYLHGGTGVGKSTLTYPLASEILAEIFRREKSNIDLKRYWKSLIYQRASEQEFWDGYENQMVCVFDDFGQQTDTTSNPNLELFEIIRASNCFPYPLHMAALEQKANTVFSSKIILVSSNLSKPKTESLNYPEALYRRFDVAIRVERVAGNVEREKFDPTEYVFYRYDLRTNRVLGTITYDQLVTLCSDMYFKRKEFVSSVDGYIEEAISRRMAMAQQQSGDYELAGSSSDADSVYDVYSRYTSGHPAFYGLVTAPPVVYRQSALSRISDRISEYYDSCLDWWNGVDPESESAQWRILRRGVDNFRRLKRNLTFWWEEQRRRFPNIGRVLAGIGLVLTGLVFIRVAAAMWNSRRSNLLSEAAYAQLPRKKRVQAEAYNTPIPTAKSEAYNQPIKTAKAEGVIPEQQGVRDLNATEILMSVVRKNLYKMYETSCDTPIGHCIFLRGRVCMMPRHYIVAFKKALSNDAEAEIYFRAALLDRAFSIKVKELLGSLRFYQSPDEASGVVESKDTMAAEIPAAIVHQDIVRYFCTQRSLTSVDRLEIALPVMVNNDVVGSDARIMIVRYRKARGALTRVPQLSVGDANNHVLRYIRNAWRYEADTEPNECGSPLIVRNNNINPGKICGIHIAGIKGTGEGFAVPIYVEDVENILAMFPEEARLRQEVRVNLGPVPVQQCQVPQDAVFVRMGTISSPIAQPSKTKIRRSSCFGLIHEPRTKPCFLRAMEFEGSLFDPREYRLRRLGGVPRAISRDIVENSAHAFLDELSRVISQSQGAIDENVKPIYTMQEAIQGIDGDLYVNSIKRSTSPGYPFVKMKGFETRVSIFGIEERLDMEGEKSIYVQRRVQDILDAARDGVVLDHYFMDTLKDERKPIPKAHKTRLFSAGPIDYLIACKMYYNGVVALLQRTRNQSHISVGSNPYSLDWGQIVSVLHSKSRNIVAGDFEGFDASETAHVLRYCFLVLIELSKRFLRATEEDVRIMWVLAESCLCSMHITGSEVYQWTHSLPSGHYLTAIINSVFVNVSFGMAWQSCFEVTSYMFARQFWKECGIVAYGDDHLVSIPDTRLSQFNQFTLPDIFRPFGLNYTMEDKDAEVFEEARPITEVSYLKRGFRRCEEDVRWLAPLSLDVILETPMWVHQCSDIDFQTNENLDWALRELALHSGDAWDVWSPILIALQRRLGYYTEFLDLFETRQATLSQLEML
uniref:Non-structural polyprotein n=1 Tax=Bat dicistrovirus TaxID=1340808 RepID=A0A4P2SY93_9VIRU|nr:non-structural polyprotein [Bat dicistrovirus]